MNKAEAHELFNSYFVGAIKRQEEESGYPVEEWFWNGPTHPDKAITDWALKGPQYVLDFIDWYEASPYTVWIAPDGRPGIELELTPVFGEIAVKMYIDLILQGPHGLVVTDLKTGARKPDQWQQLGIYASGIELEYGIRPRFGAYYMARGFGPRGCAKEDLEHLVGPMPLTDYQFSVDWWTRELAAMQRGIDASAYVARVGADCNRCSVADFCTAVGGWNAAEYDPGHPDRR